MHQKIPQNVSLPPMNMGGGFTPCRFLSHAHDVGLLLARLGKTWLGVCARGWSLKGARQPPCCLGEQETQPTHHLRSAGPLLG